MSTASLPPRSTTDQPHPSDGLIAARIEAARSALWRSELTRSLLLLVLFVIGVILGWSVIDQWIWSGGPMLRLAAWGATAGLIILWAMRRIVPLFLFRIDAAYAAQSIERDIPDIKHALSSYVALRDQRDATGLRGVVVRSIGSRAASRLKEHQTAIPSEVASSFQLWMMVAFALAVLAAYAVFSPKDTLHSAGRLILPLSSIDPPTRVRILNVNPGNTEILAGQQVEVTATIDGLNNSDEPYVLWESAGEQQKVPLRIDEERGRPFFQASLGESRGLENSGHYTLTAGDASSERFRITTSDVPVVYVESVHYQPPAYTKRPERTRRAAAIEGIEGTTVTLTASTNRPITEAQIELNPRTTGGRTTATAGVFPMKIDSEGTKLTAKIVLRIGADRPGVVPLTSYRMRVTDAEGAKNPKPVVYPIRILPDLAPEVTIATPVRNPKEIPIDAQQLIEVHALDPDFGLTRVALRMERGPQRLDDVVLWQDDDSEPRNRIALYRFRPRELGLHPGDVINIRAVAADNRVHPTKQSPAPNITVSDPVELRIVDAANMNESRPSEDGLSAPDDQPAVDPPKNDQSESDDQPQENGDASSTSSDSSGDSESTEPSDGEGDSGGNGSPSQGTAEGEQEGSSSGDQDSQGEEEGAGTESREQPAAGSNGGPDDAESTEPEMNGGEQSPSTSPPTDGESPTGSETSPQEGADSSTAVGEPSPDRDESREGTSGEQSPSTSPPTDGESPTGSETSPQEGADSSTAVGEPSADRDESREGTSDEQTEGTETGDRPEKSASTPSPPEHDGEAIERIKEYLDEQQKDRGKPSASDQSPDQGNAEADADSTEQKTPTEDRAQKEGERDTSSSDAASRDPSMSDDSAADDRRTQEKDASNRSGQSDDLTDQPSDAGDPSGDDPSTSDSSTGESSSPGDTADDAESATENSSSVPDESDSKSDDSSTPQESDSTPSSQDPPTSEPQDRDSAASPADQRSSDDPSAAASESEPADDSPPSSAESSATAGRNGSSGSGETTSDFIASDETPEPVDMEYAKKATDMVLDYLKETREQPDQELLDRLNWSEEDMDRFLNRWESARQMQRGNGGDGSQEFEEALRSLGIRDRSTAGRGAEAEQADRLRDLRDSGTRRPAPALYRDAFEAFRRSIAH